MEPTQVWQQQPITTQPITSSGWPGAFGIYKASREAVLFNTKTNLILLALTALTSLFSNIEAEGQSPGLMIVSVVATILSLVFSVSLMASLIASVRSQKYSTKEAFSKGFSFLTVKYFANSILTALVLLLSLLALIIPFFIVLPRLVLAPYFLIDKDMGPLEALKASWAQTKGHSMKVYGIIGVTLLMGLLIIVLVGIYLLVMYLAASALLYSFITGEQANNITNPAAASPIQPAAQGPISVS